MPSTQGGEIAQSTASSQAASKPKSFIIVDEPVYALCDMLRFARGRRSDTVPNDTGIIFKSILDKLDGFQLPSDDAVDACSSYAWYYRNTEYDMWPLDRSLHGDVPGEKYTEIRSALQRLAKVIDIDAWWKREEQTRNSIRKVYETALGTSDPPKDQSDYLRMPIPSVVIRFTYFRERYSGAWCRGINMAGDATFIEVTPVEQPSDVGQMLRYSIGHSIIDRFAPEAVKKRSTLMSFLVSHSRLWGENVMQYRDPNCALSEQTLLAIEGRYQLKHFGKEQARRDMSYRVHEGLVLSPLIEPLFEQFEIHPEKWPTFGDFAPQLYLLLQEKVYSGVDWSELYINNDNDKIESSELARDVMRACENFSFPQRNESSPPEFQRLTDSFLSAIAVNWGAMAPASRPATTAGSRPNADTAVQIYIIEKGDDLPLGVRSPVRFEKGGWIVNDSSTEPGDDTPKKLKIENAIMKGGFVAAGRFPKNSPGARDCILVHPPKSWPDGWGDLSTNILTVSPLLVERMDATSNSKMEETRTWRPVAASLKTIKRKK